MNKDIKKRIITISNDYGVDFNKTIPFEYFGSDEESDYMSSFSKYYNEILNTKLIQTIETNEISDGKYEMEIYSTVGDKFIIDVRAWDKLEDVLDNIKSIKEILSQERNKSSYFYNLLDNAPVTINDVHNWYVTNSKDITSYESGFATFEEYFDSLCGLNADLIPISKEEYNGLLNGTHEFDEMTKLVFEKEVLADLEM